MKYKIVVDKQSRTNPSSDRREYEIDIEELRYKGNIYDSLVITKDEDYVIRRLELTEYCVLKELEDPIKEPLQDINIELFEGDNYIYLIDMTGNKFFAEYLIKNDFVENYTLKSEFNTAMNQTSKKIELMAISKLDKDEFATYLEVNSDAVKVAWNKISEYIQMMILNGNASLAVLDENKEVLMSLDKTGQHFNEQGQSFGDIGVVTEEEDNNKNKFIAFSIDGEYDRNINNGMAWGIRTKSDNKFYPIFYIKDFCMPPKNSGYAIGDLVLSSGRFILDSVNASLVVGGISINGDELDGIYFNDASGEAGTLLQISKGNVVQPPFINILNGIIQFGENKNGSHSFRIGEENGTYVLMTDDGDLTTVGGEVIFGNSKNTVGFSVYPSVMAEIFGDLNIDGKVYANNISSDRRIKKNIKKSTTSALNIIRQIQHKEFDKKDDGKHYKIGYIAQEMEKIDPNFILKREKTKNSEERYYINELPIIATLSKAMQEQQEIIENQQETINDLLARVEKLEARNNE